MRLLCAILLLWLPPKCSSWPAGPGAALRRWNLTDTRWRATIPQLHAAVHVDETRAEGDREVRALPRRNAMSSCCQVVGKIHIRTRAEVFASGGIIGASGIFLEREVAERHLPSIKLNIGTPLTSALAEGDALVLRGALASSFTVLFYYLYALCRSLWRLLAACSRSDSRFGEMERSAILGLHGQRCPADIPWLVVPIHFDAVERHAFGTRPQLFVELLKAGEQKLYSATAIILELAVLRIVAATPCRAVSLVFWRFGHAVEPSRHKDTCPSGVPHFSSGSELRLRRKETPARSALSSLVSPVKWLHYITLLCVLLVMPAQSQVWEIGAGHSTLFNATGGSVKTYMGASDFENGIGYTQGHMVFGFALHTTWRNFDLTGGDSFTPMCLPTDANCYYAFSVRGLGVSRKWKQDELFVFVGADRMSLAYGFFSGGQADVPLGLVFWKRHLSKRLTLASHNVVSGRKTSIQSLEFLARPDLRLAVAGGLGNNQGVAVGSVEFTHSWAHIFSSYTLAGGDFRRVYSKWPEVVESNHEQVQADLNPTQKLHIYGVRGNYQSSLTNQTATVSSLGAAMGIRAFSFGSTTFLSQYPGHNITGTSVTAGMNFWSHVAANVGWYRAAKSSVLVTTLTQQLSRRFSVNEVITHSRNQTSYAFGGSINTNRFGVSVQHEMLFLPFVLGRSSPFHQAISVSLRVQIHNATASGSTSTDALGVTRYTVSGSDFLYGSHEFSTAPGVVRAVGFNGKYIVRGKVVDKKGNPVPGACVKVGDQQAWTDGDGNFTVRVKKETTYTVTACTDSFMTPGVFKAVSGAEAVKSVPEGQDTPQATIIVEREQ